MDKSTIAVAALALTLGQQRSEGPFLQLKEEQITVEYTPAANEAVLIVEAESETGLGRVEVRNPGGKLIIELRAGKEQDHVGVQGFNIETRESTPAALLAKYAAGVYDMRARTVDGRMALGSAVLSHELLPEPVVIYPEAGAVDVPTNLTAGWIPDASAAGYVVTLEQGESDGLAVMLPPGSSSFEVPAGVLAPGTPTHIEVGAIAPSGNRTLVEVSFTTR